MTKFLNLITCRQASDFFLSAFKKWWWNHETNGLCCLSKSLHLNQHSLLFPLTFIFFMISRNFRLCLIYVSSSLVPICFTVLSLLLLLWLPLRSFFLVNNEIRCRRFCFWGFTLDINEFSITSGWWMSLLFIRKN